MRTRSLRAYGQLGLIAAALLTANVTIPSQTLTQIAPAGLEYADGNYYSGTFQASQLRLQTVYAASHFPGGSNLITELRFRRDHSEPPFNNGQASITVKLSTTTRGPGELSATFAENPGADELTVFSGIWLYSSTSAGVPGAAKPFEIVLTLQTPFLYDRTQGNLLVDIRTTFNSGGGWTDGASGADRLVSRVLSNDAGAASGGGELTGDVIQFSYQPGAPITFLPAAGAFTNSVQVSLYSGIANSTIHYTTNGDEPPLASTGFTQPFTLTETTTVKARLFVNGFPASETAEATYSRYVPPDIQFIPTGQWFTNQLTVALVNHVGAGAIRYTMDGSPPTSTSTIYENAIPLTAAATIRARVYVGNFFVSDEFVESYTRIYCFGDDGVPFGWREQYFGPNFLTDPCAAAGADGDDDGYDGTEEYQHSTDPTDGDSAPEIVLTVRSVPRLTFTTIPGRSYRIQRTESLNPPDWQTLVESVLATGPELHYVDEEAPDTSYYQIELIRD